MDPGIKFLNIEYIFNRTFDLYLWAKYIVVFKIGGKDVNEYLAEHASEDYDGMRDRFHIDDLVGNGTNTLGQGFVNTRTKITEDQGSGLSYLWNKFLSLFGFGDTASVGTSGANITNVAQDSGLIHLLSLVRDFMTILALITFGIWIYSIIGWKEAVSEYFTRFDKSYKKPVPPAFKNTKIATIEGYMASGDQAQWRLAIIEADVMLDNLLKTLPIPGITVAEKLTNANRKNFTTLDDAWDAHKVRNRIAHDGSNFVLSEKLAYDTVRKFKNVFAEFDYGV